MAYRRISLDERADWLLMLEAAGYLETPTRALAVVSGKKGAPSARTLERWWNRKDEITHVRVPSTLADNKKPELIDRLTNLLNLHIDAAEEVVHDSGDLRAIDTGIGILVDKIRLLSGESTSNTAIKIQVSIDADD